jgi:hypothetical protein
MHGFSQSIIGRQAFCVCLEKFAGAKYFGPQSQAIFLASQQLRATLPEWGATPTADYLLNAFESQRLPFRDQTFLDVVHNYFDQTNLVAYGKHATKSQPANENGSSTYSMLLGAQLLSIEGRSSVVFLIFADHSPEPIVPSSVQNSATQVLCHSNSL